ncbi:rho GTPase-activating protein 24-like [Bombina bombina]|uniref:rho GTPase-activating protein 24-like n=1 Tax=Bombina bombina TaxID=8345 RepID=UPI00235ACD07|nr:rho GTPase-activating protein 24-like [Bombina bombina]
MLRESLPSQSFLMFPKMKTCDGIADTSTNLGAQETTESTKIRREKMSLSSNEHPSNQRSLQYVLYGLNLQLSKQKAMYEKKLKSLEQKNNNLSLEILSLQSTLEQQKKWYNILEIKRRNVERAREDAEKRNETLQREMKEFYETFGELTNKD